MQKRKTEPKKMGLLDNSHNAEKRNLIHKLRGNIAAYIENIMTMKGSEPIFMKWIKEYFHRFKQGLQD